jgi:hypothetical protein
VNLLSILLPTAELDPRPPLRLAPREARPLQIVGAMLEMRTDLRFHLGIHPRTPE